MIIGEHGDSSVALWSSATIGDVSLVGRLKEQQNGCNFRKESLEEIHKAVVNSAYEVIQLKGHTSWAIGYSVANLARSILRNQRSVHPVSILATGFHGIEGGEVFLSLPSQLGRSGVLNVVDMPLTDEEALLLRESASSLMEMQNQLQI